MTIFRYELESLSDLIKVIVYSMYPNNNANIHIIYLKEEDTDTSHSGGVPSECLRMPTHHRTYYWRYHHGKEYYYCQDPSDFFQEGLFLVDVGSDIEMKDIRRVYKFIPVKDDTSRYIAIIKVKKFEVV